MTDDPETASIDPARHPYRWTILAGVWLLYYCFGLIMAGMAPLVGLITRDLGISHSAMGSILGAWPLVYIAAAIPCGALLDRLGARRALLIAAMIMAASGILRGLATGYAGLFAAVAVFGIGGPLVSIGAPKLITQWFEGRDRGFAMGVYMTGPFLGSITAFTLTNSVVMPFLDHDWRAVLITYGGIAMASGIVWLLISAHRVSRAVERGTADEPKTSQLAVFLELIRVPTVRVVMAMAICSFFYNHAFNNWLPEMLRFGGMDASAAGFWAALPTAVAVVGALTIPRWAVPERRFVIMGVLIVCGMAAPLFIQAGAGAVLTAGLVLQGTSRGALMTLSMLILVESRAVGAKRAGLAGGMFFSAAEIGGVMGPLTVGMVYDLTGGFAASFLMLSAVFGVFFLLLLLLRRLEA